MLSVLSRLIDIAMVALGAAIAAAVHNGEVVWLDDMQSVSLAFDVLLVVVFFPALGIYQSWRGKPLYDLLCRVAGGWAMVEVTGVLISFSLHRADSLSRLWLVYWAAATIVLLIVTKVIVYSILRGLRREGFNQRAVAIVGGAPYGRFLIQQMRSRPDAGFSPVVVFDENGTINPYEDPDAAAAIEGVPVERDYQRMIQLVRQRAIRELWLALPISKEKEIHRIVMDLRNDFVNIRFIPDVRSLTLFNQPMVELLGVPAINLAASPITDLRVLPKRIFDRLFALAALTALAPLMLGIAVLVKLSSPGPVFFRQKRKGIDGNEFEIYKFRSMKVHKEEAGKITQATRRDPRITAVGAFLRRTSLDELPQFINVLRGEMSVVGPRPHALEHDDIYKDLVKGYMHRYRIKPGITGWAQINGYRGETDRIEKMMGRVKLDLYYMQHWTFWLDIKIVVLTLWKGFVGSNAY
ncbi:undecaprenyl-phosphate glucose phosphotransferase [Paraburkholderia sp. SIMBA_055]|jgi:putative colanic acid biosynthesis UDP-glucose lipid carrier transferase|uniref:Undecaprenyl-phosphate glucose phosphotransferase n=1 Tax=Paraburkholderia graminis (strain ATCC 700544 / DSM 17151 / LMG 18924 / NCIMB 13744 / C4D1M) TaxID=396598 RepID=B1FZB9_PARG4|nr:undecaprenyl-phosphate glucose phosphotransferase [Paraburkholderia graminis]ALE54691.1 UDP- phosphate galactosephosphotransferase [Burkholderia sp. HB1]MBW8833568.1 undecaprenyl-phosphate glucose phosphotransferase [Burkholderia sp.]AXF08010.1 undecaprenyl-phosphate glucose phosphotransferase [Paraburkholderia graminis]EDT11054.1 Undecaprenyl-phosphate glucose phosphotransferase [Paraburkholderia graminis C4D1M]MDR6466784.1 putative colanic acid biosynthesis UDP-glucose lipid carrier trans